MADTARAEFGHSDRSDRFILALNLGFALFRNWGVAMFGLMIGAIPAWIVFYFAAVPYRALLGSSPIDDEWLAAGWLGLSVPIAIYCTWVRWQRLRRNRVVVDAQGIEYFFYPWRPKRIAWNEVRHLYDTLDPDDTDSPNDLVIESGQRRITIDSENWPLGEIRSAVARHAKIQSWREWRALAARS